MAIPNIVYDIADVFSRAKNRNASQIHLLLGNKCSLATLNSILPKLVEAKVLTPKVGTNGVITYKWNGLDQADKDILSKMKDPGQSLGSGLGVTINSRGGTKSE